MRALLLALMMVMQVPAPPEEIRVVPLPLPSAEWAQEVVRGLRIVDVRPDGNYLLGSACAVAPLTAFTAAHVVSKAKGQLIAIPNHGYGADPSTVVSHVRIVWIDEKRDLAKLVVESAEDAFVNWSPRGPVPLPGAEVRGVLVLPSAASDPLAVPSRGEMYGVQDGWVWSSQQSGPGSSGSCMLDSQNRVFAILTAVSTWGAPGSGPRASMSTPLTSKD